MGPHGLPKYHCICFEFYNLFETVRESKRDRGEKETELLSAHATSKMPALSGAGPGPKLGASSRMRVAGTQGLNPSLLPVGTCTGIKSGVRAGTLTQTLKWNVGILTVGLNTYSLNIIFK